LLCYVDRVTCGRAPASAIRTDTPKELALNVLVVATALAAVVAVAAAVVVYLRARRQPARQDRITPAKPVDPLRRDAAAGMDPRRIAVGDVIAYGGRDYVVRGTLALDEGGFVWHEHLLDDVEVRRWLSVEDDEELELVLYESVTVPRLLPGPERIEHGGVTWTRHEHGTATFRGTGTTGTGPSGRVEYYDYVAGDRRLSFERWSQTSNWEISVGETVPAYALDVYPSRDWPAR
jgi:Domain of unknown function (DUF4178)